MITIIKTFIRKMQKKNNNKMQKNYTKAKLFSVTKIIKRLRTLKYINRSRNYDTR